MLAHHRLNHHAFEDRNSPVLLHLYNFSEDSPLDVVAAVGGGAGGWLQQRINIYPVGGVAAVKRHKSANVSARLQSHHDRHHRQQRLRWSRTPPPSPYAS